MIRKALKSDLVKNSAVYLCFSVLTSAMKFLVLPVLSHLLLPEDFGVIGLFTVLLQLLAPVVGLSMNSILSRSFYTTDDFYSLAGSSIIFTFCLSGCLAIVAILMPREIYSNFDYSKTLFLITIIAAFFTINLASFLAIFQLMEKPYWWGLVTVLGLIVDLAITLCLAFVFDVTYMSRIYGLLFANTIACLLAFFCLFKKITFSLNDFSRHCMYFVKLGGPLILAAISGWGLFMMDRILIQQLMDLKSVGFYALAYTLASPMLIVCTSLSRAWAPYAYKKLAEEGYEEVFKVSIFIFIGLSVLAVLLSTVGVEVYKIIIDEKYVQSLGVVPWLVFSMLIISLHKLWAPYVLHSGKTYVFSMITASGFLVNLFFNLTLIPSYGIMGAAVASIFSSLAMSILFYFFIVRFHRISFPHLFRRL